MDILQRSGSRLLFLTAELFEEGIIEERHKRRLKCKYKLDESCSFWSFIIVVKILWNDEPLLNATKNISDSTLLK